MNNTPLSNKLLRKIMDFARMTLEKKYKGKVIYQSVSDSAGLRVHLPDGKVIKIDISCYKP